MDIKQIFSLPRDGLHHPADSAGYSKEGLMESLADDGFSRFIYSPEELDKDIPIAKCYSLLYLCLRHQAFRNARTAGADIW